MPGIRSVEFDLEGRTRKLTFTVAALRELCRRLGGGARYVTMAEVLARLAGIDLEAIHAALYVALKVHEPRITIGEVDEVLQKYIAEHGALSGLLNVLSLALEQSGVISAQPGADEGEARPAGTGA